MLLLIVMSSTMHVLHDNGKFQLFNKQSFEYFNGCGAAGKAIITGVRGETEFPSMLDKLPDRNGNPTMI